MGKGPMTVSEPFVEPKVVVETVESSRIAPETEVDAMEGTLFAPDTTPKPIVEKPLPLPNNRDLTQIIMVYADHSFEVLSPR